MTHRACQKSACFIYYFPVSIRHSYISQHPSNWNIYYRSVPELYNLDLHQKTVRRLTKYGSVSKQIYAVVNTSRNTKGMLLMSMLFAYSSSLLRHQNMLLNTNRFNKRNKVPPSSSSSSGLLDGGGISERKEDMPLKVIWTVFPHELCLYFYVDAHQFSYLLNCLDPVHLH